MQMLSNARCCNMEAFLRTEDNTGRPGNLHVGRQRAMQRAPPTACAKAPRRSLQFPTPVLPETVAARHRNKIQRVPSNNLLCAAVWDQLGLSLARITRRHILERSGPDSICAPPPRNYTTPEKADHGSNYISYMQAPLHTRGRWTRATIYSLLMAHSYIHTEIE